MAHLLFNQALKHTVPTQYEVMDDNVRNLIIHYNNGVNAVLEELQRNPPVLPENAHQLQTYDEFVSLVPQKIIAQGKTLIEMQRAFIDNTISFAEAFAQELSVQERYLNPFIEPLRILLDFEKLNVAKAKKTKRVYELLAVEQETRKARMQIELRLLDTALIRREIQFVQNDQCRQSEIRQQAFKYENERRIKNRRQPLDEFYQKERMEVKFRETITGYDRETGQKNQIDDYQWLQEVIAKHRQAVGEQ